MKYKTIPQTPSGKFLFIKERLGKEHSIDALCAFEDYRSLKSEYNLCLGIITGLDSNPLERYEAKLRADRLELQVKAATIHLNLILDTILDNERHELALKN